MNQSLNMIDNELIYKIAIVNLTVQAQTLISQALRIQQSINVLQERIQEKNDPILQQKLEQCLNTAKANLLTNQIMRVNLGQAIINLSNTYQNNGPKKIIITDDQKKIAEAIIHSRENDLQATMDARLIEIRQKFSEMQQIATEYLTTRSRSILKKYKQIRQEFLNLRSSLSIRVNSALKNKEISKEIFDKFKAEQFELYKKQNEINRNVTIASIEKKQKKDAKSNTNVSEKINVERMKRSKTAEKIVSSVNKANIANQNQSKLQTEMRNIEAKMGTKNEEYQARLEQAKAERKIEKREARKSGIKKNVNSELLRERNVLASELNQMKTMYGTANNEEYQARVSQLKSLDKKIFGRKAKRVYKDLNKPIALIGGDFIELPKAYLDMRIQQNEAKTK